MAKYLLKRNCFFNDQLFQAGEVVDFGDSPAPTGSVEVPGLVAKAKAAVAAKATEAAQAEAEDLLLKSKK